MRTTFTDLQKPAYTKREGLNKLLIAYLASPITAAAFWALLVVVGMVVMGLPKSHIGALTTGPMYLWLMGFIVIGVASFSVGTVALILGGGFFLRFRLFKLWHMNLYACAYATCAVPVLMPSEEEAGIHAFILIAFATYLGAMTVSSLFWLLGVKNNHWLQSSKAPANP